MRQDDAKALDQYATFLNECENAVASINVVKVLEYPDNVENQIVKFVKWEARKATDPVYGKEALKKEQKTYSPT